MKVRQSYECNGERIAVEFSFSSNGLITELTEVDPKSKLESGVYILPRLEVTEGCFFKIINNGKMR